MNKYLHLVINVNLDMERHVLGLLMARWSVIGSACHQGTCWHQIVNCRLHLYVHHMFFVTYEFQCHTHDRLFYFTISNFFYVLSCVCVCVFLWSLRPNIYICSILFKFLLFVWYPCWCFTVLPYKLLQVINWLWNLPFCSFFMQWRYHRKRMKL